MPLGLPWGAIAAIGTVVLVVLGVERLWGLVTGFFQWLGDLLSGIDDWRSQKKVVRQEDINPIRRDLSDAMSQLEEERRRRRRLEQLVLYLSEATAHGAPVTMSPEGQSLSRRVAIDLKEEGVDTPVRWVDVDATEDER